MTRTADAAVGRWPSLLTSLGMFEETLRDKHGPCPLGCGGKKSFRFDDKGGRGTWICTHCGAGDGLDLAARWLNLPMKETMRRVDELLPKAAETPIRKPKDFEREKRRILSMWRKSTPLVESDPVGLYLQRRLGFVPRQSGLRFHPVLPYYDGGEMLGTFCAMLAAVWLGDRVVGIHRTYLTKDGAKAPVPMAKKLVTCVESIAGAAIRLGPADPVMGVAEGIETALAASRRFAMPVWATISTSGMMSFLPPEGARSVTAFADNDRNGAGQLAAYTLMNRLMTKTAVLSSVVMPDVPGTDWAD